MLVAMIAVGLSALAGFGGLSVAAMLCLLPEGVRRNACRRGAAVVFLRQLPMLSPHFLAFASASVVHVAMAHLIPEMHRGSIHVNALWLGD